ncbi:MAG: hypothetical protein ACKVWV_18465 [Planctomycetota bacterium]
MLPAGDPVRVEAVRGRVMLVTNAVELVRPEQPALATGTAHLEVGAGAEACVVWLGSARLRVWGPASLEWGAASGARDGRLDVAAHEVGRIESLVERGDLALALPDGWVATLARGAVALGAGAGGRTWIESRAGEAVRVANTSPFPVRPPVEAQPGVRIVLGDPRAEPLRVARRTPPAWRVVEWPFGVPAVTTAAPVTGSSRASACGSSRR